MYTQYSQPDNMYSPTKEPQSEQKLLMATPGLYDDKVELSLRLPPIKTPGMTPGQPLGQIPTPTPGPPGAIPADTNLATDGYEDIGDERTRTISYPGMTTPGNPSKLEPIKQTADDTLAGYAETNQSLDISARKLSFGKYRSSPYYLQGASGLKKDQTPTGNDEKN